MHAMCSLLLQNVSSKLLVRTYICIGMPLDVHFQPSSLLRSIVLFAIFYYLINKAHSRAILKCRAGENRIPRLLIVYLVQRM